AAAVEDAPARSLDGWTSRCRRRRGRRCRLRKHRVNRFLRGSARRFRRRKLFVFVVSNVIIIERAVGIIALKRAAIRRVVFRGRQRQASAEFKSVDTLNQSLADTGL